MGFDYAYDYERRTKHKDNDFFCSVCGGEIDISYHSNMCYSVEPCKRCLDKAKDEGVNEALAEMKGGEKDGMENT